MSGQWREDRLFSPEQALKIYDAIQQRIADYGREIREQPAPKVKNPRKAKAIQKSGEEPMREAL